MFIGHSGLEKGQFERGHAIVMTPAAAPAATTHATGAIARAIRRHTRAWLMRRAIASLQALDDRTLADIGIYRSEIEAVVRLELAHRW